MNFYIKTPIKSSYAFTLLFTLFLGFFTFINWANHQFDFISYISPVVSSSNQKAQASSAGGYTLTPGPYSTTDLGSPLQSNTQEHQVMFRMSNGDRHLILYYDVTQYGTYPLQVLDINLETGSYHLVDGVFGRPGSHATLLYNNKIYLTSADPGYLLEYDPSSGTARQISKLNHRDGYYTELGPDNNIYIGTDPKAGVERYNTASGVLESFHVYSEFSGMVFCKS